MRSPRNPARPGAFGPVFFTLLGFVTAAQTLHLAVSWRPTLSGYTEKLDYYARNADRIDAVFLGNSRVRAHVAPTLFDRVLAESGTSARSFNLGVNALSLIELDAIADEVIAEGRGRLKYAFIEPVFGTRLDWKNATTKRAIYSHDLVSTVQEIRCNVESRTAYAGNVRNALAFGYHYVNVGSLSSDHGRQVENAHWTFSPNSLEWAAGYRPQGAIRTAELDWWHREFKENLERHQANLQRDLVVPENPDFNLACQYEMVRDISAKFREAGIQPVFLIMPTYAQARPLLLFTEYLRAVGDETPLFSYLDPASGFHDPGSWYDARHLTVDGAEAFTRRLARDVSSRLNLESTPLLAQGR